MCLGSQENSGKRAQIRPEGIFLVQYPKPQALRTQPSILNPSSEPPKQKPSTLNLRSRTLHSKPQVFQGSWLSEDGEHVATIEGLAPGVDVGCRAARASGF